MGAILITGASGYIGGPLAQRLVESGADIRVAGRDHEKLTDRWPGVDAVELDVMRHETIAPATEGVTTAYYPIHPMRKAADRDQRRGHLSEPRPRGGPRRASHDRRDEIGGADVLSYREMMLRSVRSAGVSPGSCPSRCSPHGSRRCGAAS